MKDDNSVIQWARKNKKQVTKGFLADSDYAIHKEKLAVFMAGSPGAGKTEYSKDLVSQDVFEKKPLRIDPDEFRELFPQYDGSNSSEVQAGVGILIDNLFDTVIKKGYSFILDGTFNHDKAIPNVERCLGKGYAAQIHYLFQDPVVSWKLTQDREIVEGRNINKEVFVKHFFGSIQKVQQASDKFEDKIKINVIVRNHENNFESVNVNEPNIERFLPKKYNERELRKLIE